MIVSTANIIKNPIRTSVFPKYFFYWQQKTDKKNLPFCSKSITFAS